ncbi:unnamed protein product [Chrysoparadoxa australica]
MQLLNWLDKALDDVTRDDDGAEGMLQAESSPHRGGEGLREKEWAAARLLAASRNEEGGDGTQSQAGRVQVPDPIPSRDPGSHQFGKLLDKEGASCSACGDCWDEGGSAISPFYQCGSCGFTVHAACRRFSQLCFACPTPTPGELQTAVPNCAGVVRVRLQQAYKLNLGAGDAVYAILRLLPWKERLTTPSTTWGDMGALWSGDSIEQSLVHLYNSESTPLPTLRVEVWRSALKIMDEMLGYAEISMEPLMRNAGTPADRWHLLTGAGDGMVLLTLMFLPGVAGVEAESVPLVGAGEAQPSSSQEEVSVKTKTVHMFKVQNYAAPCWCKVCGGMLLGMLRQGYECEECGISVHKHCQVKANFSVTCRGDNSQDQLEESGEQPEEGVGLLQVHLEGAHRCSSACSGSSHCLDAGGGSEEGDHYCRVHVVPKGARSAAAGGGSQSRRTQTMFQTFNPVFDRDWVFVAPGFDSTLLVELYDAASGRIVGQAETTVFAIMQRVYDARAAGGELPGVIVESLALRDPAKGSTVRGLAHVTVVFEQDTAGLFFGAHPRRVPDRGSDEFGMQSFKSIIERVRTIIGLVRALIQTCRQVTSWENPALTSLLLLLFLYTTIVANAEYIFAVPPFCLLVHLTLGYGTRRSGRFVDWWVTRGWRARGPGAKCSRPLAQLKVAVIRGCNLLSEDLALPGNAYVRVSYLPDRHMEDWQGEFLVGETAPGNTGPDPEWGRAGAWGGRRVQDHIAGDDMLLQNITEVWPRGDGSLEDVAFVYPVLQPVVSASALQQSTKPEKKQPTWLLPWARSNGFLRFSVVFANPFNSLMDSLQGSLVVPLSSLVNNEAAGGAQQEVQGWFPLTGSSQEEGPALFLRMQLLLRSPSDIMTRSDEEASQAIEEMLGSGGSLPLHEAESSENYAEGQAGAAVISSSANPMSALRSIRGTVKDVEGVVELLSSILSMFEVIKNLLNWTHPPKTLIAYALIFVVWLVLLLIPGRYIVLLVGLYAFSAKLFPTPDAETAHIKLANRTHPPPFSTKLGNLMKSIPNDEDLRLCYRWETEAHEQAKQARARLQYQRAKLQALGLGCQWEGKVSSGGTDKHLVVQGHWIMWWGSTAELEEGRAAEGRLLLQGHAGVTSVSPLESRGVLNPELLLCVFGRNTEGRPERCLFECKTLSEKNSLEQIVLQAVEMKKD